MTYVRVGIVGCYRTEVSNVGLKSENNFITFFLNMRPNLRHNKLNLILNAQPVLYECETWSLSLRKERMLRVFKKIVLRRIFGSKRDDVTGGGENYIMKNLMICAPHPLLFG